jgi:hypothetical protein
MVSLETLLEKAHDLKIVETRCSTHEYVEIVIDNDEIYRWEEILRSQLGEPVSPSGSKPAKEHLRLTDEYGGIRNDQVLYKYDNDDGSIIIAMLWPWGNNLFTTLKMAFLCE